jgi:hypothetical protein
MLSLKISGLTTRYHGIINIDDIITATVVMKALAKVTE